MILVTLDVVSLYTNIPHQECIQYICQQYNNTLKCWHKYKINILPVNDETLKTLIQHSLNSCTFDFETVIQETK